MHPPDYGILSAPAAERTALVFSLDGLFYGALQLEGSRGSGSLTWLLATVHGCQRRQHHRQVFLRPLGTGQAIDGGDGSAAFPNELQLVVTLLFQT